MKFSLKFEDYRRAAIGDLPYIENLFLMNPSLIDMPFDGICEDEDSSYLMKGLTAYSSLGLGDYYRSARNWTSEWGYYLLGRSFDTITYYTRALIPGLTVGELIFISTELAVTLAIRNQKKYIENHEGWTLLDFAVENGHGDVTLYLISKVVNLDAKRLFDIFKANGHSRRFLISLTQGVKDRAEKEKLKNNNIILKRNLEASQKNLEEALQYAEILLKEREEKPIKHKKKHVKHKKKPTELNVDNSWYEDEHINALLKFYFPTTQNNIRALPALEWNVNHSDIHTFIQTRFTNAIGYNPDCFIYFLPLEVNKNHWIGLYVDRTPQAECVWWIDSMGGITEEWKNAVLGILNDKENIGLFANTINAEHIHFLPNRLQNDGFNCGPWLIELLRFYTANKRFPVAGEIDIGAKRQEHLAILNSKKSLTALELQGVSEKLDSFGVFGDQNPVVATTQNAQINMSQGHQASI